MRGGRGKREGEQEMMGCGREGRREKVRLVPMRMLILAMRFLASMEAMAPRENMELSWLGCGGLGACELGCTLRRVTPLLISSISLAFNSAFGSSGAPSGPFGLLDFFISVDISQGKIKTERFLSKRDENGMSMVPSLPESFLNAGGGGGGGGSFGGPLGATNVSVE